MNILNVYVVYKETICTWSFENKNSGDNLNTAAHTTI